MILQPIVNIAEICARKKVRNTILSPGSRCAPLTLAFVRHPEIATKIISDERSAAFIALGMSQQDKHPVGLVCTSGSAAYNYAPAVAEAFFQHIPLIIFTADRPPEWIDQLDGQTIRQNEIYGKHVKASYQLPMASEHADVKWHIERIISEAINVSQTFPEGPVHINVPLREPFYPPADEDIIFDQQVKIIDRQEGLSSFTDDQWINLWGQWKTFNKKLVVGGQLQSNARLITALENFSNNQQIPVVADVISNLHGIKNALTHQDTFLAGSNETLKTALQPDLLITFGKSIISKHLKLFLRKFKPKAHWHIQAAGEVADTFQSLTKVIAIQPAEFFRGMNKHFEEESFIAQIRENYIRLWQVENQKIIRLHKHLFTKKSFGEFEAVQTIIGSLPAECNLHLANSMTVRYANFIGLTPEQNKVEVFANRGTSGIDGSNSTAVGVALANPTMNILITGDMAFFYDRNAFWHNYNLSNLRIIILNNHAGGIFRLIEGPASQPELEEYFETRQMLNAANTAKDYGMEYSYCDNFEKLNQHLKVFYQESNHAKILEINTDSKKNQEIYNYYKAIINNNYEIKI